MLLLVLVKSYAYSIVSVLAMGMMVCLVVGLKNPESFRWIFGDKTSKATVGWTLAGLLFMLGLIGSSMEPKTEKPTPVAAPIAVPAPPQPRASNQKTAAQQQAAQQQAAEQKAAKAREMQIQDKAAKQQSKKHSRIKSKASRPESMPRIKLSPKKVSKLLIHPPTKRPTKRPCHPRLTI